ncbi:hypothetical protein G3576_29270 [Roseomonas stagni]|uniref:Uncharacterized protein n=1 Tax=Falsiroseomonas algicola TaxID=2716930 RepID=A0A6M1LW04_9PROT|nr:hypothetical protein [Falsiroseomonas algicola]NGM24133.1 hypothetical protein [Falsiroseomonas algicola]
MRRAPLIALMLLATAPAGAAGLSVGHEWLNEGAPLQECMNRATRAVQQVGLQLMNPTSRAVWAENRAQDQLYVFYCIPERNVVTVTGTAARFEDVDPVVTRLREAFRTARAPAVPSPLRKQ